MQSHAAGHLAHTFETIMREIYRISVAHALVIMMILRNATIPGTFLYDLKHSHLDRGSLHYLTSMDSWMAVA